MSDVLTTGSERLGGDLSDGHITAEMQAQIIAADPGVKALVEAVIEVEDYLREHGDFEPNDKRAELLRAALRLWEFGS